MLARHYSPQDLPQLVLRFISAANTTAVFVCALPKKQEKATLLTADEQTDLNFSILRFHDPINMHVQSATSMSAGLF